MALLCKTPAVSAASARRVRGSPRLSSSSFPLRPSVRVAFKEDNKNEFKDSDDKTDLQNRRRAEEDVIQRQEQLLAEQIKKQVGAWQAAQCRNALWRATSRGDSSRPCIGAMRALLRCLRVLRLLRVVTGVCVGLWLQVGAPDIIPSGVAQAESKKSPYRYGYKVWGLALASILAYSSQACEQWACDAAGVTRGCVLCA